MKTEKTMKDYENKLKEEIEELFKKGFGEDNPFKLREEYPKQYVLEFGKYCFQKAKESIKKKVNFYKKTWEEDKDAMFNEGYMESLFEELLESLENKEVKN